MNYLYQGMVSVATASMLILSGCATNEGPEYEGTTYKKIKQVEIGSVVAVQPVVVKDDGSGTFLGALIGAVIGSTMGGGRGSSLTMLGGGIIGGVAGKEIGKANAQELTVEMNYGEVVVVVVKGDGFKVGDRIRIIKDGNTVANVQKIATPDKVVE